MTHAGVAHAGAAHAGRAPASSGSGGQLAVRRDAGVAAG